MQVSLQIATGPDQGALHLAEGERALVGRAEDAHLRLATDATVAAYHLLLEVAPGGAHLVDLSGGALVNERPIAEAPLRHGDRIRVGQTTLLVHIAPDGGPDLARLLPGVASPASSDQTEVRCLSCGHRSGQVRPRSERTAFFCEVCRGALLDAPPLPAGYEAVRRLGAGAMGAVYLVTDPRLGSRALKVLLPRAAASEKHRRLFLREALAQARLNHPHIVYIYDLLEARPGVFCLVMEYVEGQSAEELIELNRQHKVFGRPGLDPQLVRSIGAQALEALAHAHGQGVVHRDVKNSNILLAQTGPGQVHVKLSDFGLAKSYETAGLSGFTRTGEIGGTLAYMAPEQLVNFRSVTPSADLYSLGVTLYRLLTGDYPHETGPDGRSLLPALQQPIVPLRERNPDVPRGIADVIERALQRSPADRFASASEMREALLGA